MIYFTTSAPKTVQSISINLSMCVCVTVSVSVCVCVCVFLCMVLPSFPWCDWLAVEPCQLLLLLGGLLGHLHGVHLQAEFHHRVGPLVQVLLLGLFLNGGLVVVVVVIVVFVGLPTLGSGGKKTAKRYLKSEKSERKKNFFVCAAILDNF